MAPRSGAATILSSPSFNDTEAASQQLLAEASSPVRRPTATPTAAQRGATLLNAARMLPKPPVLAPAPAARSGKLTKPGQLKSPKLQRPGKLPRASLSSLISEGSQRKARGKQLYDINPSPQKKRSSLPAQIAALEDEDVVLETSQVQPEDNVPAGVSESQDVTASDLAPVKSGEVVDITALPVVSPQVDASPATRKRRGRPRKSGDSVASRPSDAGTAEVQEDNERLVSATKSKRKAHAERDIDTTTNGEPSNRARPAKKVKKLKGPRMVIPDVPEFEEDQLAPMTTSRQDQRQEARKDALPRGDPQPEVRIPDRSTRLRTNRPDAEPADEAEHSVAEVPISAIERKSTTAQRVARNTRSAMTTTAPEAGKCKASHDKGPTYVFAKGEEAYDEDVEDAPEAPTEAVVDAEQANQDHEDAADNVDVDHHSPNVNQDEEPEEQQINEQDHDQEKNAEEPEEQDQGDNNEGTDTAVSQTTSAIVNRWPALNKVFRFTDSEERSGLCSTKLGRKIHRACDSSRVTLSRSDEVFSLDEAAKCKDDLIALLSSIGIKVHEERRVAFKRDAFAYLFRALALVLKAMHHKLQEMQEDADEFTESLGTMQILHPFVRGILRFKDTMDSWKVVVPQHSLGDRLIKNVESGLVVPLRAVEKGFRICLRQLKKAEESRQAAIELQRQREEQEQEMIRMEEALRSVTERRKRWQDLHIARMQCEPDPYRRRRLRFVEPVDAAETDANGNQFKRVPFFRERSAPPPLSVTATSGRAWTKEQETVLLDALQSSASLERIFKEHCGPGGALRNFSVPDFAAKLAWVRSAWAQLSRQHGWELPEWVKNIPVLP